MYGGDVRLCVQEHPQSEVRREVELALQDPHLSEEDYSHITSTTPLSLTNYIKVSPE